MKGRVSVMIEVNVTGVRSAINRLRLSLLGCTPTSVVRAAIERYDIPESDIRRVDGFTVVLWNRRRIAIDPRKVRP